MERSGQAQKTVLAGDDTYHVVEKESPEVVDQEITRLEEQWG